MHSFPQSTRSTLWGEFIWVGAIIYGENFMLRRQLSGGAIFLEGNCPGEHYTGKSSRGQFSLGAIVLELY